MKNNAHQNEPLGERLMRLQKGSPTESLDTLLNSIDNYFNNEIRITPQKHQTSLLFLGIHAVALTISEIFWGLKGKYGYKKFLETFVDGNTDDKKFSRVSNTIHNWRNVLAHQWIASSGYKIEYNYDLNMGFIEKDNKLIINPKIYCQLYLDAFSVGGKIWQINHLLSDKELNDAKERFINKFIEQ